jgi:hypothetical protein
VEPSKPSLSPLRDVVVAWKITCDQALALLVALSGTPLPQRGMLAGIFPLAGNRFSPPNAEVRMPNYGDSLL